VHYPEAPEVGDRESVARTCKQPYRVEGRDRERREEEEPGHVAHVLLPESPPQTAEEDHDPEEEADHQQYLPESPQIEVLEALAPEP
jgi:hypothetical protein